MSNPGAVTLKRLILVAAIALCTQPWLPASQAQQRRAGPTQGVVLQLKARLGGHTKGIDRIAFSPDGELIAMCSKDYTGRLWNAHTGELKAILSVIDQVKLDAAGWYLNKQYMAIRDFPESLAGQIEAELSKGARKLAISPDQQKVLISSENPAKVVRHDAVLSLWDIATGRLLLTFEAIPWGMSRVYWSPDGATIIIMGGGRTRPRLLNASTGRVRAKLPYEGCVPDSWFEDNGCQPFVFNADGSMFLKQKEPLKLWSATTGELLAELKSARLPVIFSPTDKELLVTTDTDKRTALLWEVVTH